MPLSTALERSEAVPHQSDADSFDFRKSWLALKQACGGHKLLIAVTCALTIGLVVIYVRVWPPVFVAEVTLAAEPDKDSSRDNFYQSWAVFRKDQVNDVVHLFTAEPVLEETVRRLGLTYNDVYHPFLHHLSYLWTESWLGKTYRRIKEWVLPRTPGPYDPTPEQVELARTIRDFESGAKVEPIAESNVGTLIVRGPSPRVAEIANTITAVYFEQRRARHVKEAEDAYRALKAELDIAGKEINALEQRMQKYYSENSLLLTFEKDKVDIGHWEALKASIVDLEANIASHQSALAELDGALAHEDKEQVSQRITAANPVKDALREKLSQLELSRKQTLIHFKHESPEVEDLNRQIAGVNDQLAREQSYSVRQTITALSATYEGMRTKKAQLEAELAGQRAALAVKKAAAVNFTAMVNEIPAKMRAVHDMDREHLALEKKYTTLQEKLMMAVVSRATALSAPASIRVVAAASPPGEASWPMTKLLLLGAAAIGLIAGILLALLMDFFYSRINRYQLSSDERELPLYALVGRDRAFAARLFPPPAATAGAAMRARPGPAGDC